MRRLVLVLCCIAVADLQDGSHPHGPGLVCLAEIAAAKLTDGREISIGQKIGRRCLADLRAVVGYGSSCHQQQDSHNTCLEHC